MAYACPTCGAPLSQPTFRHCPACGQALVAREASHALRPQPVVVESPPMVVAATAAPLPPPAQKAHWMAAVSRGLGAASLVLPPLALLAVPLGLVALSAIAQGKHPREGMGPSAMGVLLGLWGFVVLAWTLTVFSSLQGWLGV